MAPHAPPTLPGLPVRRGKVRDVYDLGGDRLLMVATDRISAYDWVLPTPIPDKGRVLNTLSAWWFARLDAPNHLISTDPEAAGLALDDEAAAWLRGRSMVVRKAEVVPFECVVRGHLSGSGWREYRESGAVCGVPLPAGLVEGDRIGPIFTPATKAEAGHDENVTMARMADDLGADLAGELARRSLAIYAEGAARALESGLILADTKLEWGVDRGSGRLILVDEVLTPDSSRYWPADAWHASLGGPQPSFDKQYVRDWLDASGWDRRSSPPPLPEEVVGRTRAKYVRAFETLTGSAFPWA